MWNPIPFVPKKQFPDEKYFANIQIPGFSHCFVKQLIDIKHGSFTYSIMLIVMKTTLYDESR